jgi:hypothetical protein
MALHHANINTAKQYEKLLSAVENTGSIMIDQFSQLSVSATNILGSGSKTQPYVIVDKNGMSISGRLANSDLALKIETLSRLIDEVEETQADIARTTANSGIWERCDGTGAHHFRHTEITRHPQMPGLTQMSDTTRMPPTTLETGEGVRGPASQRYSSGDTFKFNPFTGQSEVPTLGAPIRDVYIALMGAVGSGKSTFVNLCCGENLAQISRGAEHCMNPKFALKITSNCYVVCYVRHREY